MTNIRLSQPCPYTGGIPPGTPPRTVTGQTFLHTGFRLPSIVQPPAHPENPPAQQNSQNRSLVKPAARFVCPIDFNCFLRFRTPPSLHGKAHLYRISGTRQNGKTPPASCIEPAPVSPGKPHIGKLVRPAFPVDMFSKEKLPESTENGWADTSSAKKYRRENNEIHAQPAWSLASRILRQKRNNNPVFYDFPED